MDKRLKVPILIYFSTWCYLFVQFAASEMTLELPDIYYILKEIIASRRSRNVEEIPKSIH
jgi:hypothetical protein